MKPCRTAVWCGLGRVVPERVVGNDELERRLATTAEWIERRTGIRRRHRVAPGQSTSDLAVAAGSLALRSAGIGGGEAGAVVLATTTPDRLCPATAPEVAQRLGLGTVPAFDVSAACAGFVYGLATAAGLISAGIAERVLLVAAETYSAIVDPGDRTNAAIFGDGAGAVVLRAGDPDEPGAVGPFDLGSDGAGGDLIKVEAGGARQRSSGRPPRAGEEFFSMDGRSVYRQAVERMSASSREVLGRAGLSCAEVDRLVPHQANMRIIESVAGHLGIPADRCVSNIAEVGNTAAASIPIALADAAAAGQLEQGHRVLLTAFGGGLAWGSCLLTWPKLEVCHD
ncbi:beta-ketoacyl-ACP synthase III [Nonomuraea sp. NPDC050663]|uniref:beta-ketoacyl-ACP synthase III n=1 Tax=Nonomuraea sp. NPDC050663 TaxID=3364370 RepID=UPI0037AA6EAF